MHCRCFKLSPKDSLDSKALCNGERACENEVVLEMMEWWTSAVPDSCLVAISVWSDERRISMTGPVWLHRRQQHAL